MDRPCCSLSGTTPARAGTQGRVALVSYAQGTVTGMRPCSHSGSSSGSGPVAGRAAGQRRRTSGLGERQGEDVAGWVDPLDDADHRATHDPAVLRQRLLLLPPVAELHVHPRPDAGAVSHQLAPRRPHLVEHHRKHRRARVAEDSHPQLPARAAHVAVRDAPVRHLSVTGAARRETWRR